MQKFKKNDEVIIISGKHKGQSGKIISLNYKKNLGIVEKINLIKKHTKPNQTNSEGGIIEREAFINLSNLVLSSGNKDKKPVKTKFIIKDNKKIRVDRKTGKEV